MLAGRLAFSRLCGEFSFFDNTTSINCRVMDDNKMLTLASNERIPLTSSMRLLLEINHMNHCSPATVSRGGVIFVNADDIGWKPAVESWVERLECADYKPLLSMLFRCGALPPMA